MSSIGTEGQPMSPPMPAAIHRPPRGREQSLGPQPASRPEDELGRAPRLRNGLCRSRVPFRAADGTEGIWSIAIQNRGLRCAAIFLARTSPSSPGFLEKTSLSGFRAPCAARWFHSLRRGQLIEKPGSGSARETGFRRLNSPTVTPVPSVPRGGGYRPKIPVRKYQAITVSCHYCRP